MRMSGENLSLPDSLGIYVQVPFCQTKCTYCNFHTGVAARSLYRPYAQAVEREIIEHAALYSAAGLDHAAGAAKQSVVDTIYLGGGTPSLLDPADLALVIDAVRAHFTCELAEVTLEADPETIHADNSDAWKSAGINRVSLGAQSFQDTELAAAGRMHRREDIGRAVEFLRHAGLENVSLDLIAGLPHQTPESWRDSVACTLRIRPLHISIYLLEIDDGSRLGSEALAGGTRYGAAAIPTDDAMVEFYELAGAELAAAGYEHYEISNWALPGYGSRHNLKYWRREPYLGFGAGAHSFSGVQRWANAHDAASYVQSVESGSLQVEQRERLTAEAALEEELFLGLRQLDGIDVARIEKDYAVTLASRFGPLASSGLLEWNGPVVRLAPARLSVSNEVFVELMR
jgi:oxygen-independent coproporphyrinogen-3 oxidase